MTTINWTKDSLNVIVAKQQLEMFLQEQKEIAGKGFTRVEEYHQRRISELKQIIGS